MGWGWGEEVKEVNVLNTFGIHYNHCKSNIYVRQVLSSPPPFFFSPPPNSDESLQGSSYNTSSFLAHSKSAVIFDRVSQGRPLSYEIAPGHGGSDTVKGQTLIMTSKNARVRAGAGRCTVISFRRLYRLRPSDCQSGDSSLRCAQRWPTFARSS